MEVISKKELIDKVGDLKVLPFVAKKVLDTISDEECNVEELSTLIEKDQAITARVLKVANSALYGLRQEVRSLHHGIMMLGFNTIRSLVLSISTRSMYKKFGITEQIIWDHSVGAAIAAKMLSEGQGKEVEEIVFIGGLMHDLGKVIMSNETPELFPEVMMKTYNEGIPSLNAEEEIYGYNHADIGAGVTEKWGFPPMIIEIIGNHHFTDKKLDEIEDQFSAKAVACVNLADNVCKKLGIGSREPDSSIVLEELPSSVLLGIDKERLEELSEAINETYIKEKSVFD